MAKFERPIGGHPESWVLSRNTERALMTREKGSDCTWSVVLYPPKMKNQKPYASCTFDLEDGDCN